MNDKQQDEMLHRLHAYDTQRYGEPPDATHLYQQIVQRRQSPADEATALPAGSSHSSPASEGAQRDRQQRHRGLGALAALAAVLMLAIVTQLIFNGHAPRVSPGTTTLVPTPTPALPAVSQTTMYQMSFPTPTEGWAVGLIIPSVPSAQPGSTVPVYQSQPSQPVVYHYLQGRWTKVDLAQVFAGYANPGITGIAMLSTTDGWMSTTTGTGTGPQFHSLLLHYDGAQWHRVLLPATQGGYHGPLRFADAACGWMVASDGGSTSMSFDGTAWHPQQLPPAVSLVQGFSVVSPCQAWAAATSINGGQSVGGQGEKDGGLILHTVDGSWQVQQVIPNATITDVSMDSATDGWARGALAANPMLWHYHDGLWQQVPDPTETGIIFLRMHTQTDGWAFANPSPDFGSDSQLSISHYDGQGWKATQTLAVPNSGGIIVNDMVFPTPNEAWAVGSLIVRASQAGEATTQPLMLHYHDGVWTIVPLP